MAGLLVNSVAAANCDEGGTGLPSRVAVHEANAVSFLDKSIVGARHSRRRATGKWNVSRFVFYRRQGAGERWGSLLPGRALRRRLITASIGDCGMPPTRLPARRVMSIHSSSAEVIRRASEVMTIGQFRSSWRVQLWQAAQPSSAEVDDEIQCVRFERARLSSPGERSWHTESGPLFAAVVLLRRDLVR